MAQTPILAIPQVAENQDSAYLTANDMASFLERASNKKLSVDLSGGPATLTQEQFTRHMVFACSGHAAEETLTIPSTITLDNDDTYPAERVFIVQNVEDFDLVVSDGTSTINVSPASAALITYDGTSLVLISSGGSGSSGGGGSSTPVPITLTVAASDEDTAIETGTSKVTFRAPYAMSLEEIRASLSTASSSGDVTVDINVNGTSIFSSPLVIDQGSKTSVGSSSPASLSTTTIAEDAEITVDIDGAGADATGLKITFVSEDGSVSGGSGGSTGTQVYQASMTNSTTAASGTGAATKGQKFTPSENVSVHGISFMLDVASGATYKGSIFEMNGNTISAVYDADADFTSNFSGSGNIRFSFSTPISLAAGTTYVFALTRTDDTASYTLPNHTGDENSILRIPGGTGLGVYLASLAPSSSDTVTEFGTTTVLVDVFHSFG